MTLARRFIRYWAPILIVVALLPTASLAQGSLAGNRDLMRRMADGVADIIEKNFYDHSHERRDLRDGAEDG